jgi:hypothetical protein
MQEKEDTEENMKYGRQSIKKTNPNRQPCEKLQDLTITIRNNAVLKGYWSKKYGK